MPFDEKLASDEISPVSSCSSIDQSHIPDPVPSSHPLDGLENFEVLPKIFQEGVIFVASGPALLLQAAQPGIKHRLSSAQSNNGTTASVAETSPNLTKELSNAFQATISYLACFVFGTRSEKQILLDRLQTGRPPLPINETYTTHPETQLWMVATLYATSTDFYQRIYGRVDFRSAQRGYAEFTRLIRCLGMPSGLWPESRAAFWTYWDEQIKHLSVSADAHRFAYDLKKRADLPRWATMMMPLLRIVTVEMLPPHIRDAYGLKSTRTTRSVYCTTMGFSIAVYPALPKSLRSYPVRYYLEGLRKHLDA